MAEDQKTDITDQELPVQEDKAKNATIDTQFLEENQQVSEEVDLKLQLSEQKDKYLRLVAEFDNYKKRNIRERIDLIRNASQELIQELLVILDDMDRAKKLAESQKNDQIFPEGMKLVHNKLLNLLQSKGLEAMESDGKTFDPQFHEAITEIPASEESMKGKIFETIEKGYLLNQKIIRFAKVIVAK
jgi:molecular chaperone GrpE